MAMRASRNSIGTRDRPRRASNVSNDGGREALFDALHKGSIKDKTKAAAALWKMAASSDASKGCSTAIDPLVSMLSNANPESCTMAAGALRNLTENNADLQVRHSPSLRHFSRSIQ